jgi:putative colanic acid biosynthesis glycosyltransferase WcaI
VKILYVSQYFPPEMGAPAARAAELARHWVDTGHQVTVLTGFPNHPTGVVPPEYRSQFRRLVTRGIWNGSKLIRTWLLPFPNRKPYERMLNYGSFFVSSAITGLFTSKPDVLIATSPQLLVALSGWWLAFVKRVPFVFEVRDLWPESLAAVGVGRGDSLLIRVLGKIAGFLYRRATCIVVVTAAFKTFLIVNWNVRAEKIFVVENGVETDLFAPLPDRDAKRKELGADGKFLVCYAGTMGLAHGLETLIEAAATLQSENPRVEFLLVGEGADKERIAGLASQRGLTNLSFVGQQPRENMPSFISASDACVVMLKKADLFKTVIPSKMLEFMSCARPVILAVDGQAREITDAAEAGIFVEPEDAKGLVEAIQGLAADPTLCKTLGANGRAYILRHFSRKETALDYLTILRDLLPQRVGRLAVPKRR